MANFLLGIFDGITREMETYLSLYQLLNYIQILRQNSYCQNVMSFYLLLKFKNREICFYFSRNLTANVTKSVFSNLIRSLIMCLGTLTGRNRMT